MQGCEELQGIWNGIKIPASIQVFDCRWPDAAPTPRTEAGRTLWGSERAAYALRVRATYPVVCQAYEDFRQAPAARLAKALKDALDAFRSVRHAYQAALRQPAGPDEGGSVHCVHYRPVAVALNNYGWAIVADADQPITRPFQ